MYTCRIYKVCNSADGKEYVGSTKQKLNLRLSEHKSKAKRGRKSMVHEHIRELGPERFYIEELECKEVSTRLEQMKLEVLWQEKLKSELNHIRAYSSLEKRKELDIEYRKKNKDKIKENGKRWEAKNREHVTTKAREYRRANRDKINERQRKFREENRDKVNSWARNEQSKKREAAKESGQWKCEECDKLYSTKYTLARHAKAIH